MLINEPQVVHLRLHTEEPGRIEELAPRAREISLQHVEGIGSLWERLLSRNIATGGVTGL